MPIRPLIRRDMAQVMTIEERWTHDEFIDHLREPSTMALVSVADELILGYVVYKLLPKKLRILNIAVDKCERNTGVGRELVNKLKDKLSVDRRSEIITEAPPCVGGFFAAMGFSADQIIEGCMPEDDTVLASFKLADEQSNAARLRELQLKATHHRDQLAAMAHECATILGVVDNAELADVASEIVYGGRSIQNVVSFLRGGR